MTYRRPTKKFAITLMFAAGVTLTGLTACSENFNTLTGAGNQCDSKACFSQHFSDCKAATFTTDSHDGATARYQIKGPGDDLCRVKMTFVDNPNPAWQDQSVTMVLDPDKSFAPQMKSAVADCLAHDAPGDYQCSGGLRGIMAEGGDPNGEQMAKPEAVTEPPCGGSVEVSGEPLFAMPRNGRWGYVNRAGDWVIEPQWSQAEPFSEGRAAVSVGNSRRTSWGVIDRSGDYVVKPRLKADHLGGPHINTPPIKPFSQGCAAVSPASGRADDLPYFITRDGRFWLRDGLPESLAGRKVKEFGSFSEGLAWFRVFDIDSRKAFGYIDTQGQLAIDVNYWRAGNFVDGLAPAEIKNDLWGYINPEGELVWPGKWSLKDANDFSEGLALVETKQGGRAYFDGEEIVIDKLEFDPPRTFEGSDGDETYHAAPIEYADDFSSGLAAVALDDHVSEYLYMDKQGNATFSPSADRDLTVCYRTRNMLDRFNNGHHLQFRRGLARLRVANENGECDEPKKIANGKFVTYEQSHIVYIDTDGQIVLEEPFRNGDTDARPSRQDTNR